MTMEQTLVIIKPDGVARQLVGRIIARFEDKGLHIVGLKATRVTSEQARKLYAVHEKKPFYKRLLEFIQEGPVVVMVLEGPRAVSVVRTLLGKTFGFEAEPGTIRGDFGLSKSFNLVHGSDSAKTAAYEIPIFFSQEELLKYDLPAKKWLYNTTDDLEL